ncbi:MAG: DoxX family protein [Comamonas sp.]|uniref:DoxX family protein n=1 Tax=Comamonas sp. TaxID=34028 RepID=UPI00282BB092|nr:DoxX family protein [Comamonas sp.]MDR0214019.1 DoxX family protein [Comamonas sp.]
MKFWSHFHHPQAAMVLLRVTLAVLLLFHGWAKLRYGIGSIERMVEAAGAPGWLAYAVYLGEVVAPLLLLVGLWVVPAALVIAINMVVAFALVHTGQVLQLHSSGGWALELQAFFFVSALVVAMGHAKGK